MVQTALSSGVMPRQLLFGIEASGVALLLLALLLARPQLALAAVAVVAVAEGTIFVLGGPVLLAPFQGALLLASAELALWSIERARPAQESLAVGGFRAGRILLLSLVGAALGLVVLATSDLPASGGFDLTAIGMVAAVALAALILWLGREALRGGASGSRP